MKLQTARQGRNEDPRHSLTGAEHSHRKLCAKLAHKTHRENAERMLLASFVAGLGGTPGKQVRYANPQTMQQALTVALSIHEAKKTGRI